MAPKLDVEFIVLRLSFSAILTPGKPHMSVIRRKPNLSGSTIVGDWIQSTSRAEIDELSVGQTFSYCEWRILSSNIELFTVDNNRFDKIFLFIGQEELYWAFYYNIKEQGYINGTVPLNFSYCACCLNTYYEKMINMIKHRKYQSTIN